MTVTYAVTVYNKAAFLPHVLAAIAAEYASTGGEILIVDDGSTDGSAEVLAGFCTLNPAARVITQPNAGVAAATNEVLSEAVCRYTRLIDGDDIITSGSTQALIDALEKTGCSFGYGLMRKAGDEVPQTSGAITIERDPLTAMLTRQPFIPSQTLGVTMVMRRVLPLPQTARTSQDFSLGVLLSAHTHFAVVDTLCCAVPAVSGGLSSGKARMFRDTVILALGFAGTMRWSSRYRRLALCRAAGRARNYLRRHAPDQRQCIMGVTLLAVISRLPVVCPFRRGMDYVISGYDRVLKTGQAA